MENKSDDRGGGFFRRWVHSCEEDTATNAVYRPAEYNFPPARGRAAFECHADGSCTYIGIGATDVSAITHGTWQIEDDPAIIHIGGNAGRVIASAILEGDRLLVRKNSCHAGDIRTDSVGQRSGVSPPGSPT